MPPPQQQQQQQQLLLAALLADLTLRLPRPFSPSSQTLGKIVSPAALVSAVLPVLARLAADPVPNIRFSVAIALETLAPRMDASTRAVVAKPLLASLALDGEADVQHFAMRALAALG